MIFEKRHRQTGHTPAGEVSGGPASEIFFFSMARSFFKPFFYITPVFPLDKIFLVNLQIDLTDLLTPSTNAPNFSSHLLQTCLNTPTLQTRSNTATLQMGSLGVAELLLNDSLRVETISWQTSKQKFIIFKQIFLKIQFFYLRYLRFSGFCLINLNECIL